MEIQVHTTYIVSGRSLYWVGLAKLNPDTREIDLYRLFNQQ